MRSLGLLSLFLLAACEGQAEKEKRLYDEQTVACLAAERDANAGTPEEAARGKVQCRRAREAYESAVR